jgi:hypothetical protein
VIYDQEITATTTPTAWIDEILRKTMPSSPTNPRTPPNAIKPKGTLATKEISKTDKIGKTSQPVGESGVRKREGSKQDSKRARGVEASTKQQSTAASPNAKEAKRGEMHGYLERREVREPVGSKVDHAAEIERIAYGRKS